MQIFMAPGLFGSASIIWQGFSCQTTLALRIFLPNNPGAKEDSASTVWQDFLIHLLAPDHVWRAFF
jgi:hypothetical protein